MITAILVDGGFYRKRADYLFGKTQTPKERANELITYCYRHINDDHEKRNLYRIFYYDCPPAEKVVYHPLTQKNVQLKKTDTYAWTNEFFDELRQKRKVALRFGELLESSAEYALKDKAVKKLCRKEITIDDLTENDFEFKVTQKGVDMRIGLDIASMAYKKQVNQIILIAGDSDFVPAAKHARREGIDFILDPMWKTIRPGLIEHIDGLKTCTPHPDSPNYKDPLCKKETPEEEHNDTPSEDAAEPNPST